MKSNGRRLIHILGLAAIIGSGCGEDSPPPPNEDQIVAALCIAACGTHYLEYKPWCDCYCGNSTPEGVNCGEIPKPDIPDMFTFQFQFPDFLYNPDMASKPDLAGDLPCSFAYKASVIACAAKKYPVPNGGDVDEDACLRNIGQGIARAEIRDGLWRKSDWNNFLEEWMRVWSMGVNALGQNHQVCLHTCAYGNGGKCQDIIQDEVPEANTPGVGYTIGVMLTPCLRTIDANLNGGKATAAEAYCLMH